MENSTQMSSLIVRDDQLVAWPRVAAISSMVAFSLPTFITGLEVYAGLTVQQGLLALLIGSVLLTLIGGAMGAIGAKTRMSSYLLVRIAFGDKGAGLVNLAFAISLIGWFGVNIDLFSGAVSRLAEDFTQLTIPEWVIEVVAGLCMVSTTVFGFRAINLLASLLIPILALLTFYLFFVANNHMSLSEYWLFEKTVSFSLSDGVGAIVGAIIIGAIILPDITRFSRHWTGGIHTAFWSYMVVELIVIFVAGFAAAAIGQTEILDLMLTLGLGSAAFVIVIAGSWVLNSLNLYSTMLSLEATWPKCKGKGITVLVGLVGVLAAFLNILDVFISFLVFLAAIFVPVAGIIIADYFFIKPQHYCIARLEQNVQFSKPAFIAWLVGAAMSVLGEQAWMPTVTTINVLDAVILSGVVYVVMYKFFPAHKMLKPTNESNQES